MFVTLLLFVDLYALNELNSLQQNLTFGTRQVEQIKCDRPEVSAIIDREPELKQRLEWCFAGAASGRRVYWDSREPTSGQPAEHLGAYGNYPAMIRVTHSSRYSSLDKCVMLMFELENLPLDRELQLLGRGVLKKSREEFATNCVRLEFEAGKRTQEYFLKHPIEHATPRKDPYYIGIVYQSASFPGYLELLKHRNPKEYNPMEYFLRQYDAVMARRPPREESK